MCVILSWMVSASKLLSVCAIDAKVKGATNGPHRSASWSNASTETTLAAALPMNPRKPAPMAASAGRRLLCGRPGLRCDIDALGAGDTSLCPAVDGLPEILGYDAHELPKLGVAGRINCDVSGVAKLLDEGPS